MSYMQSSQDVKNQMVEDALKILSFQQDRGVDPRIYSLLSAQHTLGDQAIEVIMLGLSRRLAPTSSDAEQLIYEWETKDPVCCFNGSVADLLSFKNTWILAVSYKHDDPSCWKRKGARFESKMQQQDQDTLVRVIEGLGSFPNTDHVMIWCDRILSTRLGAGQENSFGWYNAGLLPYVCLRVLTLSTHISDTELEQSLWIKAEHSLGRLGEGLVLPTDAQLGIVGSHSKPLVAQQIVKQLALMILSGYWPKDTGYWSKDYEQMTLWALGVLCRADSIILPPIFDTIKPVDNMELLAVLPRLALLPEGLDFEEPPLHTSDVLFYLKASSWNFAVKKVWNNTDKAVSHYMGREANESYRFSWWVEKKSNVIFGTFITVERATIVLAIPQNAGYNLYRMEGNPRLYHHAEVTASSETKTLLAIIANCRHIAVHLDETWHLMYCWDGSSSAPVMYPEVGELMRGKSTVCDVLAPQAFLGITASLYQAAVAKGIDTGTFASTADLLVSLFDEWNTYIRGKFSRFLSIRDTRSGPVWLEGFDDNAMSFGFLDFLTRRLIIGDRIISPQMIPLRSKREVMEEINRVAETSGHNLMLITKEIFGSVSADDVDVALDTDHIARFMGGGGFTSGMKLVQFTKFLCKSAQLRGYWRTDISARRGKLQVAFENDDGDVRILQRATCLREFSAVGLVHPRDEDRVLGTTDRIDDDPEVYRSKDYWKGGLEDRVDRSDMFDIFNHSRKEIDGGMVLCMVDMTASLAAQKEIDVCSVHDAYGSSNPRDSVARTAKLRSLFEELAKRDSDGNPIVEALPQTFEERSEGMRQAYEERQKLDALVASVTTDHLNLTREIKRDRLARKAHRDSHPRNTEPVGEPSRESGS